MSGPVIINEGDRDRGSGPMIAAILLVIVVVIVGWWIFFANPGTGSPSTPSGSNPPAAASDAPLLPTEAPTGT